MLDVTEVRRLIPATREVIYLNTGWSGPSPARVVERVRECLELESREGPTSRHILEAGRQVVAGARQAVARLLGVEAEEIALMQNTTEGINAVLNGLPFRPGDQVVTTDLEHPAIAVPCYFLGKRRRVRVRVVKLVDAREPGTILERLEAALAPGTRLLCLSHIMYTNGLRLPLEEVQALARGRGIPVLVDGAQAAGQIPLNLRQMGCDFYALPGHKWLLGPDGTGALFIRRDLIPQVRPAKVGYWALQQGPKGEWVENREGIQKFEISTTSTPLWAGLAAAIEFLQFLGLEEAWSRVRRLASLLCQGLEAIPGVEVLSPRHGALESGLVAFSLEGVEPGRVVDWLWERERAVARTVAFPAGVRLSTAFFNTEEEIERVVGSLRGLARAAP